MKKLLLIGAAALVAACSSQPESGYPVNVTVTGDLAQLPNDTLIFPFSTASLTAQPGSLRWAQSLNLQEPDMGGNSL